MEIVIHQFENKKIAEINTEELIIVDSDSGFQLMADLYYQGFESIIIDSKNIIPDFFDLKSGLASEILQKFSNYQMNLVVVGDLINIQSKSLNDFISESNKGKLINFLTTFEKALEKLKNTL